MPRLSEIPSVPWDGIIPSYFRSSALAFIYPFAPCCVAIPRKTFEIVGYFNPDLRAGEDSEMWGRIALKCQIAFTTSIGAKYYAVANNKMTDNPSVMLHHPFFTFISTQNPDVLKKHPDYENILLYLQKEEVAISLNNLYAGNPKQARVNLHNVKDRHFLKQKYGLLGISYLPIFLQRWILPIANSIGRR